MNKMILMTFAIVAFDGFIIARPLLAASHAPAAKAEAALTPQQVVDQAAQAATQMRSDGAAEALLKDAKGVFILPHVTKRAFVVGNERTPGVLLQHEPNGGWSEPAFLTAGSLSLNAAKTPVTAPQTGPVAMLLMSDRALHDFTEANGFRLNGRADLTIASGTTPAGGKADIVVWTGQTGPFAAVELGGADVTQNARDDHTYYGKQVEAETILSGAVTNPAAKTLQAALPG